MLSNPERLLRIQRRRERERRAAEAMENQNNQDGEVPINQGNNPPPPPPPVGVQNNGAPQAPPAFNYQQLHAQMYVQQPGYELNNLLIQPLGIQTPAIQARRFKPDVGMITQFSNYGQYGGMAHEDPIKAIRKFMQICDSYITEGVTKEQMYLLMFPFFVRDAASDWLDSIPPGIITTWEGLQTEFLDKYYPPVVRSKAHSDLITFQQQLGETLGEAWTRFRSLLSRCPGHGYTLENQLATYFKGLDAVDSDRLNLMAGGTFMMLAPQIAQGMLERLVKNDMAWKQSRAPVRQAATPNTRGTLHLDEETNMHAQIALLKNQIKMLTMEVKKGAQAEVKAITNEYVCSSCGGENHPWGECENNPESVFFVGNRGGYQGQGFQGNRNTHPGMQWSNPSGAENPHQQRTQGNSNFQGNNFNQRSQGNNFQPRQTRGNPPTQAPIYDSYADNLAQKALPAHAQEGASKLEEALNSYMKMSDDMSRRFEERFNSQGASLRLLETQVSQIAQALHERLPGQLPSDTEKPGHIGQCKAIELRSGLKYLPPPLRKEAEVEKKDETTPCRNGEEVVKPVIEEKEEEKEETAEPVGVDPQVVEDGATPCRNGEVVAKPARKETSPRAEPVASSTPRIPFPSRVQKQGDEKEFEKFMDMVRKLHINLPLVDALRGMPKYMKFMKDVLSNKRRFLENELVGLPEECSAICQSKIPPKLNDPGSFTIPISIGTTWTGKALCDLGSSINLMPKSVFEQLKLGQAQPTTMTLQMADRTLTQPEGQIEDVLVKVGKFIFPCDFIILDYDACRNVPIILGRPFLATGRTLIDVENGELTMRVQDDEMKFKVFRAMKFPEAIGKCFRMETRTQSEKIVKELEERRRAWEEELQKCLSLGPFRMRVPRKRELRGVLASEHPPDPNESGHEPLSDRKKRPPPRPKLKLGVEQAPPMIKVWRKKSSRNRDAP